MINSRMNFQCVLLFFFLLSAALWDGNTGIRVFQETEGLTSTFIWHSTSNETIKFFCRRQCKDNDILIKTRTTRAENKKYELEFQKTSRGGFLSATIKELTKSDAGRYRLGMGDPLAPSDYDDIEIRVFDAQDTIKWIDLHSGDEGGDVNISCLFPTPSSTKYFCKGACSEENNLLVTNGDYAWSGRYILRYHNQSALIPYTIIMTIKRLTMSDSGRYMCGLGTSLKSAFFQEIVLSVVADPSAFTPPTTIAQSLSFNSESTTLSSTTMETNTQFTAVSCPVSFLPLVGCVIVIIGLLAVVLLLLHKVKTNTKSDKIKQDHEECYLQGLSSSR